MTRPKMLLISDWAAVTFGPSVNPSIISAIIEARDCQATENFMEISGIPPAAGATQRPVEPSPGEVPIPIGGTRRQAEHFCRLFDR